MKPSIQKTIEEIIVATAEVVRDISRHGARLIFFLECLGICAVPFIMIQHHARDQFWYCLGAYGIYLFGVSQVLRRWI